jgi:hypothetical protein
MYATLDNPTFTPMPGFRGLGASDTQIATSVGGAVGSSAVAIGVATGAIAGPVGAIIGAGIGLVTTLISTLIANSGCGITCVETSSWANQAEPLLLQNINAYFAQPAPRSLSSQAQALANFDAIWATLQQQCSQPGTGAAGQRCISDRQAGACTWKQSATSSLLAYVQYGEPNVGECWDWVSGYRTPIANDTDVAEDSASAIAQGAADTSASAVSSSLGSLGVPLLIGAAVLAAWMVLG